MEPTSEIEHGRNEKDKKIERPKPLEKPCIENIPPNENLQTIEELEATRRELAETSSRKETQSADNPNPNIIPSDNETLIQIANGRWIDYNSQRDIYNNQKRKAYFGEPKPETWLTSFASKIKPLRNITRMVGDFVLSFQSRSEKESLKLAVVNATILSRREILDNPKFQNLLQIEENNEHLMNLLDQEIFREVNCRTILMLEGLSPAQFHLLAKQMGDNPRAFLSDDRRENAGRFAADNKLPPDGKHPFVPDDDPDSEAEKVLWGPVFPELKWIPIIKDWRMSRTHAVIYAVKDSEGNDILLLPVHVDPKTPVAALKFGKDALKYHQSTDIGQLGNAKYVGTGLYDLGIKYFLKKLNGAKNQGLFADLNVTGVEKLTTTNKITRDDKITDYINGIVLQEKQADKPT